MALSPNDAVKLSENDFENVNAVIKNIDRLLVFYFTGYGEIEVGTPSPRDVYNKERILRFPALEYLEREYIKAGWKKVEIYVYSPEYAKMTDKEKLENHDFRKIPNIELIQEKWFFSKIKLTK